MNVSLKSIKPSRIFEGDTVIWMVLFFLCIISILEVYSASSNMTYKTGVFWKPVAQHTLFLGVGVLTAVFAFMSLVGCSFYGEKSFEYLFGKRHSSLYKAIYGFTAFIGCINSPKAIWSVADICNGLMAVPNLFAINFLGKEVEYK